MEWRGLNSYCRDVSSMWGDKQQLAPDQVTRPCRTSCEWWLDAHIRRKTTLVTTYVSLSSHERHVSFMVPCKKRQMEKKVWGIATEKGNAWVGTPYYKCVRCNSLLPATCPHFLHSLVKACMKLKTAPYQHKRLIITHDLSSSSFTIIISSRPLGCAVIFHEFQLTQVK